MNNFSLSQSTVNNHICVNVNRANQTIARFRYGLLLDHYGIVFHNGKDIIMLSLDQHFNLDVDSETACKIGLQVLIKEFGPQSKMIGYGLVTATANNNALQVYVSNELIASCYFRYIPDSIQFAHQDFQANYCLVLEHPELVEKFYADSGSSKFATLGITFSNILPEFTNLFNKKIY
jgi:hypothetical protein